MSIGAGRSGMSAVVMMMSTSFACAREHLHLRLDERRAHLLGVAAGALAVFCDVEFDELGAHALDLLLDGRPRVEGADDGAHAARGADRGQPGHAGADHQHLGRRHPPGRRHLPGEEAAVEAGRLDHRAIAGDVGHRRQRVHLLRAGDARNLVHGDGRRLARRQPVDDVLVLAGIQEADQRAALADQLGFVHAQRRDAPPAAAP